MMAKRLNVKASDGNRRKPILSRSLMMISCRMKVKDNFKEFRIKMKKISVLSV